MYPNYPPPPQPTEPVRRPNTASLTLGIVGLVFAFIPFGWYFNWILCMIAIAIHGQTHTRQKSTTGLVCGIVGLGIGLFWFSLTMFRMMGF